MINFCSVGVAGSLDRIFCLIPHDCFALLLKSFAMRVIVNTQVFCLHGAKAAWYEIALMSVLCVSLFVKGGPRTIERALCVLARPSEYLVFE